MRVHVFALILALAVPALAGCLDPPESPLPAPSAACVPGTTDANGTRLLEPHEDPIRDDRALQWDHESYNLRTCSLPAIGWDPLHPSGRPHKYIGEIDMRGDLNLGAVAVLGNGESPRVYLVDITDRADPQVLSWIDQSGTYVVDVKLTEDGKFLYAASQDLPGPELAQRPTEPTSPSGFTVYNIQDRTRPRYVGTVVDQGQGCHMLSVVQVAANQDAVFCVGLPLRSYLIQRENDRIINFGSVTYTPTPSVPPTVPPPLPAGPHDMTPFHEGGKFGAGRSYMVVSHWGQGVRVLDITDAPVMREVGSWTGQGAKHYYGNVHTAMMFRVGEHRYIVASPELTSNNPAHIPSLWVLNADDLSRLTLIGEWYHPNEHPAQALYNTIHQWQVAPTGKDVDPSQVRIYMTYNHAGVWVLDFSKMLEKDLYGAILGFNSARKPIEPESCVPNAVLSTWDVGVVDGYIYGSDRCTGLWVFHYEGDTLGDNRLRGFA